jgi:hypothetical protein
MRPTFRRIFAIGAITTTGLFASIGTTHAAPAPRFAGGHVEGHALVAGAKVLNTFIVPKGATGAKGKFSPTKLTIPDVSGANCSETDYSFLATNITANDQQLSYDGSPILGTIASGTVYWLCVDNGDVGGSITFNLVSNQKANLTLTLLP